MVAEYIRVTPELAAALTRPLFCWLRNPEKRVAVFTAFSDESGSGDSSGSFVVGGCIADEGSWPYFSAAWQERVLDEHPHIPYLHMVEIRRQEFRRKHGLSELQAEDRVRTAANIIETTGALRTVVSHVDQSDLRSVLQARLKSSGLRLRPGVDEPDYLCFFGYAFLTVTYVHHRCKDAEKVDFVVSRKKKITNQLRYFREELKKYMEEKHPEMAALVGELIPGRWRRGCPFRQQMCSVGI